MSPADEFLASAIESYDGPIDLDHALRLLAHNPDLSKQNLHVAAACADISAIQSLLNGGAKIDEPGGPRDWSPLQYLAYSRLPGQSRAQVLDAARALLAAGADPNAGEVRSYGPPPFTVLTGVFGDGERGQSTHAHAIDLARVLLEAGADPNDGQTLYNRMFSDSNDHLHLLFEFGLGKRDDGPWFARLGTAMESPRTMLRVLLAWAISHDQRDRVRLLAEHGVDITSKFTEKRSPQRHTPVEFALVTGKQAVADLLLSYGVPPAQLAPHDRFVADVFLGDAVAAQQADPAVVASVRDARPGLVTWAAAQGAANSVELLVAAGFDINSRGRSDIPSNEPWHTALHAAALQNDPELIARLLALGADPTIRDAHYDGTPLDWAEHFAYAKAIEALGGRPDQPH